VPRSDPPPQKGLDEVERALSVLEGRHPEHERTKRETAAAAAERRKKLERELSDNARRSRLRGLTAVAVVVAVAAAGWVGLRVVTRARMLRAALDIVEAPFVGHGIAELKSNEITGGSSLDVDAPAASCMIAVATAGAVRVHAGATSLEASGSAGWCACGPQHVVVEGDASGVGLALLQVEARAIGGPLARPWLGVAPTLWGAGGDECADAALDSWIADHKWSRAPLDEAFLKATPARAALEHAGFKVASGVEAGRPFGVVDLGAGECAVAVPAGGEAVSLRAPGGARRIPAAHGAIAWCTATAETTSVWRDGASPAVVLTVPEARIGGLLGARECADAAGIHVDGKAAWLRDEDLAGDAKALLAASMLSQVTVDAVPQEPGAPAVTVAALVLAPGALVEWRPATAVLACEPHLDATGSEREVVCASTEPVSLWRKSDALAWTARAPLPFWLSSLEAHHEQDAVAIVPELLALARRLARDGFQATTLEAVTELPDGVRVKGRAGEDAVVAVGLAPKRPWAFPYTDGVPWDLGDVPRVVALQPGGAVKLTASPGPTSPMEQRRTVVFRRAASH